MASSIVYPKINKHPKVTIVHKPWQEVGKETYCGVPGCEECRVIDKVTQGGGSSVYHDSIYPWQAQVIQVLEYTHPKPYRVWIIEITRQGKITYQYKLATVVEHWSYQKGTWVKR